MERRERSRLEFGLKVVLLGKDQAYFTRDINIKGCFLPGCQSHKPEDPVDLAIDLPGFGYVLVTGKVRHVNNNGLGVSFIAFKDPKAKGAFEEFLSVVSLCSQSPPENELA